MSTKIKGKKYLKEISLGKRICVVGIGNFDRADDYAGIAVIEKLEKVEFSTNVKILNAGPVPEAFTGVIKEFKPDLLVIIDAAMMEEKPGTIRAFTDKDIDDVYMVTPHRTPMSMFTKYLRYFLKDLKTIFLGIQPLSLSYMEPMDENVKLSVKFLSQHLVEILSQI